MHINNLMIILFNKPFNVLSQFTDGHIQRITRKNLSNYIDLPDIYPAGRLDKDSEGLLILTSQGKLQQRISNPRYKMKKTYWVQIEGKIDDKSINLLRHGVRLKDGKTRKASVKRIDQPHNLWPRNPPIRERKNIPDEWIEIILSEGKNRQIRRMTAAVGYPTLRLIRVRVGDWRLDGLKTGAYKIL